MIQPMTMMRAMIEQAIVKKPRIMMELSSMMVSSLSFGVVTDGVTTRSD